MSFKAAFDSPCNYCRSEEHGIDDCHWLKMSKARKPMYRSELKTRKQKLLDERMKLEEQLKALEQQEKLPALYQIAEIIHETLCHHNHTDGCGWFYEKWTDEKLRDTKADYLERAKLLTIMLKSVIGHNITDANMIDLVEKVMNVATTSQYRRT